MPGKGKSTKPTPEQEFSKAFSSGDISTKQINEAMGGKKEITGKSGTNYIPVSNKPSTLTNLGFIKAKTLEKNPNAKTMMVDGKEMPIQMKGSPYKMYGKETSPMTMKGESPLAKYGCTRK